MTKEEINLQVSTSELEMEETEIATIKTRHLVYTGSTIKN